jgi:hypothetical protein
MLRGEIQVWEKEDSRPFSGFFEIESNNQLIKGEFSRIGTKEKLKCLFRSESPRHFICSVDLKENPNPREIIRFKFQNLSEKGQMTVQGINFLGQVTSWLCTFTTPD